MQFVDRTPYGILKSDVVCMKSFPNPPEDMKSCIIGLCMLTSKPTKIGLTYSEAKRIISRPSFFAELGNVNLSHVPYENWEKLNELLFSMKKAPTSSTILGRTQEFLKGVLQNKPTTVLKNVKKSKSLGNIEKEEKKTDERAWSIVSANAINSLKKLNRFALSELKAYPEPPPSIRDNIAALICVLLNGNSKGLWSEAKSLLTNLKSINKLLNLDPNSIPRENVQKLQDLLAHSTLIKDAKKSSIAADGFIEFAHAVVEYRCAPRKIPACQSFRHTRSQLSMYGALIPLD
jgi:hypothetical protein